MKIRGGMNYIIFDMENGYVLKAGGELLFSGTFWCHSMFCDCIYKDKNN